MLDQKEIKYLINKRTKWFGVRTKIEQLIRPKIIDLVKGSFDNLKNMIIVSGALSSFSLFSLKDNNSFISQRFALISISGFLLTTLLGVVIITIVHTKRLKVLV